MLTYLDRLDVLLVVQSHVLWVQAQKVPDLVRHISANPIIPAVP